MVLRDLEHHRSHSSACDKCICSSGADVGVGVGVRHIGEGLGWERIHKRDLDELSL